MKWYKIKDEYAPEWGDNVADTSEPINLAEVERLAAAWGVPISELMEQLEEL